MDGTQGNATGAEPELELTPEQLAADAAADAEFEAAFNHTAGSDSTAEGSTSSSTSSASAAAEPVETNTNPAPAAAVQPGAASTAAPAEDDLDAPVTITKRQLAELTSMGASVSALQAELRRTVDVTNGRFGSLQQTMKEVREQAAHGVRPSFDQMEALEEDFPELAAVLKRDLGKIFGKGNETQPEGQGDQGGKAGEATGAAAPSVNPLDAPEVQEQLRNAQLAIVDATHAGWRELPRTNDWQSWVNQLPAQQQQILRTAKDAATLNDAIADFKGWQGKQAAAASASNQRGKRLENAVPATTGSAVGHAHVANEDELFEQAFKAQRR